MNMRWLRRVPLLRVYPALHDAHNQLKQCRRAVEALEESASRQSASHQLALRTVQHGDTGMLAAPPFDDDRLVALARDRAFAYRTADPFPHFVEDGLLDAAFLERVLAEFESMDRGWWRHSEGAQERKWSTEDPRQLGPFTAALIAQLNGGRFITFLEQLTGIEGLVADPHLRGGGLHEIRQGGLLGVHADFNVHPRLKLYRRLNLLIYLNQDWQREWGGELELWDRGGERCVRQIEPTFNRALLFDTSNYSYHGHPHPLACPPDRSRKSVALYYYSLACPPDAETSPHGTIFLEPAAAAARAFSCRGTRPDLE
jgi:hypothetical protein